MLIFFFGQNHHLVLHILHSILSTFFISFMKKFSAYFWSKSCTEILTWYWQKTVGFSISYNFRDVQKFDQVFCISVLDCHDAKTKQKILWRLILPMHCLKACKVSQHLTELIIIPIHKNSMGMAQLASQNVISRVRFRP